MPPNYRLKPEFRDHPQIKRLGIDTLRAWYRVTLPGVKVIAPVTLAALKKGGVVNAHAVKSLVRYLNRHAANDESRLLKATDYDAGEYTVESVADPTDDAPTAEYRGLDYWKAGWQGLLAMGRNWRDPLVDERLAVPRDEADTRAAALTILRVAGSRRVPATASPEDADRVGEEVLRCPRQAFADWVVSLWRVQPRVVMYSVATTPDRRPVRTGISVVIPLAPAAFRALCRGELSEYALTAADVRYPSSELFTFGLTELPLPAGLPRRAAQNAQLLTGIYQIAMLCPMILRTASFPTLGCPLVHATNTERALTFGFQPTGTTTAGTRFPVAVLSNPLKSDPHALHAGCPSGRRSGSVLLYGAFAGTLMIAQSLHFRHHRNAVRDARTAR